LSSSAMVFLHPPRSPALHGTRSTQPACATSPRNTACPPNSRVAASVQPAAERRWHRRALAMHLHTQSPFDPTGRPFSPNLDVPVWTPRRAKWPATDAVHHGNTVRPCPYHGRGRRSTASKDWTDHRESGSAAGVFSTSGVNTQVRPHVQRTLCKRLRLPGPLCAAKPAGQSCPTSEPRPARSR
jgi:hypothetical protein